MAITNTAPHEVHIGHNGLIGGLDQWTSTDKPIPLDDQTIEKFINKLEARTAKFLRKPPRSAATLSDKEIVQRANLNVPDEFKPRYLQLLYKYRKVISTSKTDLGQCKTYKHRLYLKDEQAVSQKRFPLKLDH